MPDKPAEILLFEYLQERADAAAVDEVTTGGVFGLRGAQNAANASDTKILRGSYMTVAKLN